MCGVELTGCLLGTAAGGRPRGGDGMHVSSEELRAEIAACGGATDTARFGAWWCACMIVRIL